MGDAITIPAGAAIASVGAGGAAFAGGLMNCNMGSGAGGGGEKTSGGTQFTSKTLWKDGKGARIDVENPNPSQRPGQIHFQEGNAKYLYDPAADQFVGAPNRVNALLRQQDVRAAIQKGLRFLGQ